MTKGDASDDARMLCDMERAAHIEADGVGWNLAD